MKKIIVVRSPESDFRPEKWITNKVIAALRQTAADKTRTLNGHEFEVVEVNSGEEFNSMSSQSMFYSDETMTKSFCKGVLGVLDHIADGDVVYFADGWSPAVPVLKFHMHCAGIKAHLTGFFHSSVETPGDFLYSAGSWVRSLEETLLDCFTETYVATDYGVDLLNSTNVNVIGLPVISPQDTNPAQLRRSLTARAEEAKPVVGWSHRWAEDKRPEDFIELAHRLGDTRTFRVLHPVPLDTAPLYQEAVDAGIEFVLCDTKDKYWTEVAKLSFLFSSATLETFGYSVIDAVVLGAIPVVPNRACYPYMYRDEHLYYTLEDAAQLLSKDWVRHTLFDVLLAPVFVQVNAFEHTITTRLTKLLDNDHYPN